MEVWRLGSLGAWLEDWREGGLALFCKTWARRDRHVADVPRVQGELPPAGVQGAAPLAPPLPHPIPHFPFLFVPFVSFVSFVISTPCPFVCPPCPLWSPLRRASLCVRRVLCDFNLPQIWGKPAKSRLNISPRAAMFGNWSNDAHPGDSNTVSPGRASAVAAWNARANSPHRTHGTTPRHAS